MILSIYLIVEAILTPFDCQMTYAGVLSEINTSFCASCEVDSIITGKIGTFCSIHTYHSHNFGHAGQMLIWSPAGNFLGDMAGGNGKLVIEQMRQMDREHFQNLQQELESDDVPRGKRD